jgi:chromosome segregation ATPase
MPEPIEGNQAKDAPAETTTTPKTDTKKMYTQDELDEIVKAAVSKAVNTEKDKLYETIEKLKSDIEKNNKFFQQIEEEKKKAIADAENQKREKMSETQKLSLQIEELQKQIAEMAENHRSELDAIRKRADQKALDDHKEKLLLKYQDEIVPGLVSGNSIEELNASVEVARREYQNILAKAEKKKQNDTQVQAQNTAPIPLETKEPLSPQPSASNVNPRSARSLQDLRTIEEEIVGSFVKNLK